MAALLDQQVVGQAEVKMITTMLHNEVPNSLDVDSRETVYLRKDDYVLFDI